MYSSAGMPGGQGTRDNPIVIEPIEVVAKKPPVWSPLVSFAAVAIAAAVLRALSRA